jgi:isoprene synthase
MLISNDFDNRVTLHHLLQSMVSMMPCNKQKKNLTNLCIRLEQDLEIVGSINEFTFLVLAIWNFEKQREKKNPAAVSITRGMATELLCLHRPISLTHKLFRNPLPKVIQATPLTLKLRCSVSTENVSFTETETETRRSANYEPNSWDYDYLLSSDTDESVRT